MESTLTCLQQRSVDHRVIMRLPSPILHPAISVAIPLTDSYDRRAGPERSSPLDTLLHLIVRMRLS
jgi:hypothetical protein